MTAQNVASTKWTEKEDEFLRANYRVKSARIIANELGKTKNSVIGRAGRIGISRPYQEVFGDKSVSGLFSVCSENSVTASERTHRNLLAITREKNAHLKRLKRLPKVQIPVTSNIEPLNGVGVKFWDLNSKHCRWISGDPKDMMFCGHEIHAGSSYCPTHCTMSKSSYKQVEK